MLKTESNIDVCIPDHLLFGCFPGLRISLQAEGSQPRVWTPQSLEGPMLVTLPLTGMEVEKTLCLSGKYDHFPCECLFPLSPLVPILARPKWTVEDTPDEDVCANG